MTETPSAWLTQDAYERLKRELAGLVRLRSGPAGVGGASDSDARDRDSSEERSFSVLPNRTQRIRKLQEMLRSPVVGQQPPDDGVAEPGMVVTIRYAGDPDTETLLLAEREQDPCFDVETCSLDSPLGRALADSREGEQRQYHLPNGQTMTVTLIRAVPYGCHANEP